MTPDKWRAVERLYHAALDRETGERAAFLQSACASDEELRGEVESLLDTSRGPGHFWKWPDRTALNRLGRGACSPGRAGGIRAGPPGWPHVRFL